MQACRLCQNRDFLLQSTLSQNLLLYLLRSEAVLYPTSGTTSDSATILQSAAGFGHHFLPRYVANESNSRSGSGCSAQYPDGLLVQRLVTEVACAPCSMRVLISSEDLSNLRHQAIEMLGRILQPRRVHVVLFYRNMKDFIVLMYSQQLVHRQLWQLCVPSRSTRPNGLLQGVPRYS